MTIRTMLSVLILLAFCIIVTWDVATNTARKERDAAQEVMDAVQIDRMRANAILLECQLMLIDFEMCWRKYDYSAAALYQANIAPGGVM